MFTLQFERIFRKSQILENLLRFKVNTCEKCKALVISIQKEEAKFVGKNQKYSILKELRENGKVQN